MRPQDHTYTKPESVAQQTARPWLRGEHNDILEYECWRYRIIPPDRREIPDDQDSFLTADAYGRQRSPVLDSPLGISRDTEHLIMGSTGFIMLDNGVVTLTFTNNSIF